MVTLQGAQDGPCREPCRVPFGAEAVAELGRLLKVEGRWLENVARCGRSLEVEGNPNLECP